MANTVPVLTTWNVTSTLARTTFASQQGEIECFVMNHWIQSTCLVALATRQWLCFSLVLGPGEYDTTEGKFRTLRTSSCWAHPVSGGWDTDTNPAFTDSGTSSCCGQLNPPLFTIQRNLEANQQTSLKWNSHNDSWISRALVGNWDGVGSIGYKLIAFLTYWILGDMEGYSSAPDAQQPCPKEEQQRSTHKNG